jgi:hypothetical protein
LVCESAFLLPRKCTQHRHLQSDQFPPFCTFRERTYLYTRPNPSSQILKSPVSPPPSPTTHPRNYTPRVLGVHGGVSYFPSLCVKSVRLRPNEWILMSAWDEDGDGLGVLVFMNRLEIGPAPLWISSSN